MSEPEQAVGRRIRRARSGLLVVDFQERLLPAIDHGERVVAEAVRLVSVARVLGIPVLATEQYPRGLGRTVPDFGNGLDGVRVREKLTFSACGADGLVAELEARDLQDVVLCGIETHVCVCQTALDLLDQGRRVFVVADAVSSRTPANRQIGLDRMRASGATVVSMEMVVFEWLERAGTEEFKQVLPFVK
ncbi:MAG: hydrolase [Verrucomicrobiales bacterium]|nr:hydrolase [Verrucomicrobiales bacterium]